MKGISKRIAYPRFLGKSLMCGQVKLWSQGKLMRQEMEEKRRKANCLT